MQNEFHNLPSLVISATWSWRAVIADKEVSCKADSNECKGNRPDCLHLVIRLSYFPFPTPATIRNRRLFVALEKQQEKLPYGKRQMLFWECWQLWYNEERRDILNNAKSGPCFFVFFFFLLSRVQYSVENSCNLLLDLFYVTSIPLLDTCRNIIGSSVKGHKKIKEFIVI